MTRMISKQDLINWSLGKEKWDIVRNNANLIAIEIETQMLIKPSETAELLNARNLRIRINPSFWDEGENLADWRMLLVLNQQFDAVVINIDKDGDAVFAIVSGSTL